MKWPRAKVTNASRLIPRDCPYCKRFMSEKFLKMRLKEVQALKSQRMKEAIAINRKHENNIGRPRSVDYEAIRAARANGKKFRELAKEFKTSMKTIYRALELGNTGTTDRGEK